MSEITQIFIKFLDNKTLTLQFPPKIPITLQSITHHLQSKFQFQLETLILTLNGKLLSQSPLTKIPNFSTLTLTTPLRGGKGGFGSLLRGAATKAGQKKTNNFDACRDMSGRRLRHVNAEKKMEEWKAEEEERKLEKKAEKYLKDMVKKGKGGKRDDGAEKYVDKYRQDSARCVEEVDKSVRQAALAGFKRKPAGGASASGGDSKKLKFWMGMKMGESDSDSDDSDGDTESDASDAENEKSAVTDNNGMQSDSSKDASYGSVSAPQLAEDQNGRESSDSGSGEENETPIKGSLEVDAAPRASNGESNGDGHMERSSDGEKKMVGKVVVSADMEAVSAQIVSDLLPSSPVLMEIGGTQLTATVEVRDNSECKTDFAEEAVAGSSDVQEATSPLNFDDFSSASELEVLGLERLKSELQARGLKCGGTLQERASRLFLLKTTPLDKIPKKLLAKK